MRNNKNMEEVASLHDRAKTFQVSLRKIHRPSLDGEQYIMLPGNLAAPPAAVSVHDVRNSDTPPSQGSPSTPRRGEASISHESKSTKSLISYWKDKEQKVLDSLKGVYKPRLTQLNVTLRNPYLLPDDVSHRKRSSSKDSLYSDGESDACSDSGELSDMSPTHSKEPDSGTTTPLLKLSHHTEQPQPLPELPSIPIDNTFVATVMGPQISHTATLELMETDIDEFLEDVSLTTSTKIEVNSLLEVAVEPALKTDVSEDMKTYENASITNVVVQESHEEVPPRPPVTLETIPTEEVPCSIQEEDVAQPTLPSPCTVQILVTDEHVTNTNMTTTEPTSTTPPQPSTAPCPEPPAPQEVCPEVPPAPPVTSTAASPGKPKSIIHRKKDADRFKTVTGVHFRTPDSLTDETIDELPKAEEKEVLESMDEDVFETPENYIFNEVNPETDFEKQKLLGRGRFGQVYRCVKKNSNPPLEVAGKFIRAGRSEVKKSVEREVEVLRSLGRHPQLLWFHSVYYQRREIAIFTELITGGELFERIANSTEDTLTEPMVIKYLRQILRGIEYMHSRHIIHRDLKPENILCKSPTNFDIKVIDFGFATFMEEGKAAPKQLAGTTVFMAPETIKFEPQGYYTDIWSVGVIAYNLLCGFTPFEKPPPNHPRPHLTDQEILVNIEKGRFDFEDEEFRNTTKAAKDFICKLLQVEPKKRPTATECLKHEWFKERKLTKPMNKVSRQVSLNRVRALIYLKKATDASHE